MDKQEPRSGKKLGAKDDEEMNPNHGTTIRCLLISVNGMSFLVMIPKELRLLRLHITKKRQVIVDPLFLKH